MCMVSFFFSFILSISSPRILCESCSLSKHMKIYANMCVSLCNWNRHRKWKRNYADTMVIYSLWLSIFFQRLGKRKAIFYVAQRKKNFLGQVLTLLSLSPHKRCGVFFCFCLILFLIGQFYWFKWMLLFNSIMNETKISLVCIQMSSFNEL